MKKILVVEDDPAISKGITVSLEAENYEITVADNGSDGYYKALNTNFDLILLDLMLPDKSGEDICRDLRAKAVQTPIIMLTSKSSETDKVLGLEFGADDYITKPFSVRELIARIKAVLRRVEYSDENEVDIKEATFADVHIDFVKLEAKKDGRELKLTAREFDLLKFMISHEGEVIQRSLFLHEVWGYDEYPTTRTIDTFMLNLRKKIEDDPSNPKHLITIPKAGYKFVK